MTTEDVQQVRVFYSNNAGQLEVRFENEGYVCQTYETLEVPTNSPLEPVSIVSGHVVGSTQPVHDDWVKQRNAQDPNYVAPTATPEQEQIAQLSFAHMQDSQTIATLQKQVAQLAYNQMTASQPKDGGTN